MLTNFVTPTPTTADTVEEPNFYLARPEQVQRNGPFLGWVRKHGRNLYRVNLGLDDLTTHVAIFGMTGSGKSTTAGAIVSRLVDLGVSVLIIDWHNEYRGLVIAKGGLVFTPGRAVAPFAINPLNPAFSKDLSEHICLVTDIFADVFKFTPPQAYMFREALHSAYKKSKQSKGFSELPTLSSILQEIGSMPIRSAYDNETKLALLRRIKPLTEGQAGMALNVSSPIDLEFLLRNFISIELGHFKEEEVRKIFTSILLKLIYDYWTERAPSKLQHVTVIEESRSIVPARRLEDPPSIGERMISELRKFGEGLIIISQFPTQISREILKNAATRICHEVKTEDDQAILKGAMKLTDDQASYLHYLKPGEALINLPLIPYAFPIYVEPERAFSQLSDDQLKSEMQRRFYGKPQEIELLKPQPRSSLSRLAMSVKLYQLLRKHEKLNLNQLQEALGLSTQAFLQEVLPCLDELVVTGKVKKFLGEDGKSYYRATETGTLDGNAF
ncbi:MAG: ATP-binding protein [Candidatus Bathyarchaeia archaeon]